MCYEAYKFSSLAPCEQKNIRLGDTREVTCDKSGIFDLLLKDDDDGRPCWIHLTNVLFVPKLRMSIISVSSLDKADMQVSFVHGACTLPEVSTKPRLSVALRDADGLYWLNTSLKRYTAPAVAVATACSSRELWHARLGHANSNAVDKILGDDRYNAAKNARPDVVNCNDCTETKGTRGKHDKPLVKPGYEPGQCVFMDLCGPMQTASWGGGRYLLLFIDAATRFIWHVVLDSKKDVVTHIDHFISMFERAFTYRVRRVHSDNGTEFCNARVKQLLAEAGVNHTFTAPYNPRSNGVVERANRSVVEKIRAMLTSANLDGRFWAEAAIQAVRTLNAVPEPVLDDISPYEALHGSPPDLSTFRVFGCRAYVPVPDTKRRKLDEKTKPCILLGSGEGSTYRVFEPHSELLQVVRHVRCDETEMPGYGPAGDISTRLQSVHLSDDNDEKTPSPYVAVVPPPTSVPDPAAPPAVPPSPAPDSPEPSATPSTGPAPASPPAAPSPTESEAQRMVTYTPSHATPSRRSARISSMPSINMNEDSDSDGDSFNLAAATTAVGDPDMPTLSAALSSPERDLWVTAIHDELRALVKSGTWKRVPRPRGKRVMATKFVLKVKRNPDQTVERYKARLVVLGFLQRPGDYGKTFSPVADFTIVLVFLIFAAFNGQPVHHLDVANAFRNGLLEEELYITLPAFLYDGAEDDEEPVYLLLRSLYGLKQVPRAWYNHLTRALHKLGLRCNTPSPPSSASFSVCPSSSLCTSTTFLSRRLALASSRSSSAA